MGWKVRGRMTMVVCCQEEEDCTNDVYIGVWDGIVRYRREERERGRRGTTCLLVFNIEEGPCKNIRSAV